MISLYSQDEAVRMEKRARRGLISVCALLGAALAVCIVLCTRVRTGNAEKMLYAVIGVSSLAGWAAILLFSLLYLPSRAEYMHMKHMLSGEPEEYEGRIRISPAVIQIPRSILVRKVFLTDGEETRTLYLDHRLIRRMPENGTPVRVQTVKKYITAWEALDENA